MEKTEFEYNNLADLLGVDYKNLNLIDTIKLVNIDASKRLKEHEYDHEYILQILENIKAILDLGTLIPLIGLDESQTNRIEMIHKSIKKITKRIYAITINEKQLIKDEDLLEYLINIFEQRVEHC